LLETLKNAGGIGLAAPQTGLLKRAFVIDTSPLLEDDNSIMKYEQTFINPEIVWQSDYKTYYNEGCLSIPDIFEDVLRPEKITVRYFDENFNRIEEELDGIKARIFQHEFDHLEGILFIDKLNILKRKLLTGRLNKIANSYKKIK
jgi:peptide deformylase